MASQSYQLSFGVTLALLCVGILVTVILISAFINAVGTITSFVKQTYNKRATKNSEESVSETSVPEEESSGRKRVGGNIKRSALPTEE